MKLTLGFSPCPNDTFIFDALVNNKIDTLGIEFDVKLEDVQTLNQFALEEILDITKISYGALPLVLENYIVLNSGSALGTGVGPLLISGTHKNIAYDEEYINNCLIAIPGENTTAHMLFSLAFPNAKKKIFLKYDEIEDFVLNSATEFSIAGGDPIAIGLEGAAGVIIHENRFTYQQKGLIKIIDLGDFWQNKTGLPIPLGGIVAKRNLDVDLLKKVDSLIKQSIEFAFSNYPELTDYIRQNSQEMEEDVMRKHIDLYVNDYSINLGDDGQNAVKEFLKIYTKQNHGLENNSLNIFL